MSNPNQDAAHQAAVAAAKGSLQAALATANTQAAVTAAHVTFYLAVLRSGQANGHSTGALQALHNLGQEPGGQAGDN